MTKEKDVLSDPVLKEEALRLEENYEARFRAAHAVDDDIVKYIPSGYRGYKAIQAKNINRCLRLGYDYARNEKGEPIKLDNEFHEAYLMIIPEKAYNEYQKIRARDNAKLHNTKAIDLVQQRYDSSGNAMYSDYVDKNE